MCTNIFLLIDVQYFVVQLIVHFLLFNHYQMQFPLSRRLFQKTIYAIMTIIEKKRKSGEVNT